MESSSLSGQRKTNKEVRNNMPAIGLDIGTTTICAIVLDEETGVILETITEQNNSFVKSENIWERIQDPSIIVKHVEKIICDVKKKYSPVSCIGLTGQMHGIVYINEEGTAVSPLYTWQDGRGDFDYKEGLSYAEYLKNSTGYKMATGFGAVTHFYNTLKDIVPCSAKCFCTIQDYAALKLSKASKPLIHSSNAASIGFFNIDKNCFDRQAIRNSGLDDTFFPEVSQGKELLGITRDKIPVAVTIGDNQASFLGSVKSNRDCLSVNIGTSSQISVFTGHSGKNSQVETRPFIGGRFLLVGSPLCGGRAYALLESFFRSVIKMATGEESARLYDLMDKFAYDYLALSNSLEICTKFCGTRDNPSMRGSISNIGVDNFTPQHLVVGVLQGIVQELYDLYEAMIPMLSSKPKMLICSGNGVRLNIPLQRIISKMFNMPIHIPLYKEEAAYGAALFALVGIGYFKSVEEAQSLIRYE